MYVEALLVRERLLGPNNGEYRYSLCYRGTILADNGQHYEALVYWMYELDLCQQYSIPLDSKHLRRFISLFSQMLYKTKSIPMEFLFHIIGVIMEELEHNKEKFNYNLCTLLFLVTIMSQILTKNTITATDLRLLYRQLHSINHHQYTTLGSKMSLLHLSLDDHIMVDDYHIKRICKYPCFQTARILLQCGADVNALDALRNTPMHVIASNKSTCDKSILNLLCDAGVHLDYVNALEQTSIDIATNLDIKQHLQSKMKLSLKCLCARLIRKKNIPFQDKFPISLINFIEKH